MYFTIFFHIQTIGTHVFYDTFRTKTIGENKRFLRKRLFRLGKSHSGGSFAAPEDRRGALGGEAVILEVFGGQKV